MLSVDDGPEEPVIPTFDTRAEAAAWIAECKAGDERRAIEEFEKSRGKPRV
jgi:hypothetical protein